MTTTSLAPVAVPEGILRVPVTVVVDARAGEVRAIPPTVAVEMGALLGGRPGLPVKACRVMVTK